MCGIVGALHLNGVTVDGRQMCHALKEMRHRGPDGSGIWCAPDGSAALGHTRLRIMGLRNGAQPLVAENERIVVVVNGEFYDFERIRADLQAAGAHFRTDSDSEIFLHLYERYGTRGLQQLRGEFSILLYDRVRRTMLAIRDRLGVKPLYYAQHDGNWYFASEIKGLIALGVEPAWDEAAYASRGFYLRDQTLFRNVRSVRAGTWISVSDGGAHCSEYWDLTYPTRAEAATVDPQRIVEEVRDALEDAVRLRLRADVPVGVYLSGGVDSSGVLGLATALTGRSLDAFHLSFPGVDGYDESSFATIAAQHNCARLHTVDISQADLADNFGRALWHNETPFFNAHAVAKFLLSKRTSAEGFKTVLTGEGADEVFGGYPHFRRDMLLYNTEHQDEEIVAALRRKIEENERGYGRNGLPQDARWMAEQLGHGVSWVDNQSGWFSELERLYRPAFRTVAEGIDPYRQFYDRVNHRQLDGRDPVHRSMYLWAKSFLPNFVLTTLGDRMEMAHSIEGRVPFLDHHVVELASRVPVWMKIKGATEKHVFREALRPYLPDALYRRKKHYFRAPPATLQPEGKLHQLVHDTLRSTDLERLPFFEPSAVRALLGRLAHLPPATQDLLDPMLTELTSLVLLQRQFGMTLVSRKVASAESEAA
ncbi:asparagine synthase (glutamine-hydrolyzing) [Burkholderia multivorans]|uniref:asparagine synthase (glutamine-hydrolyzing) n=1 Tax=Burkholderia multivorans TaxID=87883 RepID=UPI000757D819|nr:asparagine synthase (glutamine-hydrolyzing) [Burkholderia multivorans]KVR40759.1 asparagine synthetase B [Burkholderia multivorans]